MTDERMRYFYWNDALLAGVASKWSMFTVC